MRLGIDGIAMRNRISAVLAIMVLLAAVPARSDEPQRIIPGVGIGPARLGMTEEGVRSALAAAELDKPWCRVDVLATGGRVNALGTRFGGCLELHLPPTVVRFKVISGVILPEMSGIGGSAHPLIRAFGPPARFTLTAPINVLLWRTGLVARTAVVGDDEAITYLAVVPPQTMIPPFSLLSAAP